VSHCCSNGPAWEPASSHRIITTAKLFQSSYEAGSQAGGGRAAALLRTDACAACASRAQIALIGSAAACAQHTCTLAHPMHAFMPVRSCSAAQSFRRSPESETSQRRLVPKPEASSASSALTAAAPHACRMHAHSARGASCMRYVDAGCSVHWCERAGSLEDDLEGSEMWLEAAAALE
jgi:hypothetical protein